MRTVSPNFGAADDSPRGFHMGMKDQSSNSPSDKLGFTDRMHAIVEDGRAIRADTADAVREALGIAHHVDDSLAEIFDSVIDGALGAASQKIDAADTEDVLREVVDGLGDGFESAALALELTLKEAQSGAKSYPSDDVDNTADELNSTSSRLVNAAQRLAGASPIQTEGRAAAIIKHAENTATRIRPVIKKAVKTALGDAQGFAKQAAGAGAAATREAIGTLLSELGSRIRKTDDKA